MTDPSIVVKTRWLREDIVIKRATRIGVIVGVNFLHYGFILFR